ncbi:hypothetical protein AALP_AAs43812U000100 [Arabis alpina]|uniref:Uncharacterized protein n=1 Tax=Arabis alpina TaxID=50452 RepID=A0A087FXL0_ARAAL|nr:hypothetical protein AALP_AAs43812U000100 [Arabis alpina]
MSFGHRAKIIRGPGGFSRKILKLETKSSILQSQNLNIETIVGPTICLQSTYWRVGEFDHKRKQYFVVAGPKPEGFGRDSMKSFFKIEKS